VLAESPERRVGLVVGVRVRGEVGVWHRGRLPNGPGTIFEIGSITKTFTATQLADMAREGIVALDDPVQGYLPDGVRLPKGLLWSALTRDRSDPYAELDDARLMAAVSATRPRRDPGRKVAYSNYGMGCSDMCWRCVREAPTSGSFARASGSRSSSSTVDRYPGACALAPRHRKHVAARRDGALAPRRARRRRRTSIHSGRPPSLLAASLTGVADAADRGRSRDDAPSSSSRTGADRPRLGDRPGRRSPPEGARNVQAAASRRGAPAAFAASSASSPTSTRPSPSAPTRRGASVASACGCSTRSRTSRASTEPQAQRYVSVAASDSAVGRRTRPLCGGLPVSPRAVAHNPRRREDTPAWSAASASGQRRCYRDGCFGGVRSSSRRPVAQRWQELIGEFTGEDARD
jgi:hypothetical protein